MRLLVTGGAGFIGSTLIRVILKDRPDWTLVNLDALTYAGNLETLADLEGESRLAFVKGDIADSAAVAACLKAHPVDAVLNLAAESHVDRSILDASAFVRTNVDGTRVMLAAAMATGVRRFVQVSTDEVYGSLGKTGLFREDSPIAPNSPYAASKASADLMGRAFHHTFGMDVVITRCSNNYGPYQFPEKLIPLFVSNAMDAKPLPVYGDGLQVRDWIHVEDHARGILAALEKGKSGEVYNLGGGNERTNLEITKLVLSETGRDEGLIRHVQDRPGHDRRYAIDDAKARRELGWAPRVDFEHGIRETVRWYVEHRPWWERVKSGAYRDYYERQYGKRQAIR